MCQYQLTANSIPVLKLPIEKVKYYKSKTYFNLQSAVKMLLRSHNLDVLREERKLYWRSVYLGLEAASSSAVASSSKTTSIKDAEALVEATSQLYNETVQTCFGTMGEEAIFLSS